MSDSDGRGPDRTGAVKLGAIDPQRSAAPPWVRQEPSPPAPTEPTPIAQPAPDPPPVAPSVSSEPAPAEPGPEPVATASPAQAQPANAAPAGVQPASPTYAGESGAAAAGAVSGSGVSIGRSQAAAPAGAEPARLQPDPPGSDSAPRRPELSPAAPVASPYGAPPASSGRDGPRIGRGLIIGGVVALLGGVALAMLFRPGLEREEPARATAEREGQAEPAAATGPDIAAAREPFQPPDREAVRQAYARAAEVYRTQGASGLAQFGQQCFRSLQNGATYRQLDFCLAFDAYGAAIARSASGGQAPGAESYFGQTETRHMQVTEAVMAGQSDASARLVDIRRIAIEVARQTGPVAPARAAAPPAPAAPGAQPVDASAYAQARDARPTETTPAPRSAPPLRMPPLAAPEQPAQRAEAPAMPSAAEVAAARPAGRGPSFSCRSARTRSERMICADPSLASLDRRLNAAFEDAIAAGADRRSLRLEQDRWLAEREAAAPDASAVADSYRRRIGELNQLR